MGCLRVVISQFCVLGKYMLYMYMTANAVCAFNGRIWKIKIANKLTLKLGFLVNESGIDINLVCNAYYM